MCEIHLRHNVYTGGAVEPGCPENNHSCLRPFVAAVSSRLSRTTTEESRNVASAAQLKKRWGAGQDQTSLKVDVAITEITSGCLRNTPNARKCHVKP